MLSAFTKGEKESMKATYGVSESDPAQIELKLNEDMSFSYQDLSVPSNSIEVKGNYELRKNKVLLLANDGQTDFHRKWKISKDHKVARSRKGMSFYTLRQK